MNNSAPGFGTRRLSSGTSLPPPAWFLHLHSAMGELEQWVPGFAVSRMRLTCKLWLLPAVPPSCGQDLPQLPPQLWSCRETIPPSCAQEPVPAM